MKTRRPTQAHLARAAVVAALAALAAPAAAVHDDTGAQHSGAQLRGQAVLLAGGDVRGVVELKQDHGGRTTVRGVLIGLLLPQAHALRLGIAQAPCSAGTPADRHTPTSASFHGNASDFTGLAGFSEAGRRLDRIASVAVIATGPDDAPAAVVACGDLAVSAVRPGRRDADAVMVTSYSLMGSPAFFAHLVAPQGATQGTAAIAVGGLRPDTWHTLSTSPRSCDEAGGPGAGRVALVGFVTDGAGTAGLRDDVIDVWDARPADARSLVVTEGPADGRTVVCGDASPVGAYALGRNGLGATP